MNDTRDKSNDGVFLDGSELFENLFREAPLEEGKKVKPPPRKEIKPAQQIRGRRQEEPRHTVPPTREAPPVRQPIRTTRDAAPRSRRVDPAKTQQIIKPDPPPKVPEMTGKIVGRRPLSSRTIQTEKGKIILKSKPIKEEKGKGSNSLKTVLLLLLLGVGAAIAASYLGFVDIGQYVGWPLGEKARPAAPQAAKPAPEKKAAPQAQAKQKPETPKVPPPAPKVAAPAKEVKPKPSSGQQAKEDSPAKSERPAPAAATQTKEIPPKAEIRPPVSESQQKTAKLEPPPSQAQAPSGREAPQPSPAPQASPPRVAAPKPAPVPQSPATAALPPSQERQPAQVQPPHVPPYPFSVYLGSFVTLERARTAVSIHEKDYGISSYWVKVDLGEKGIWYRVFAGYFRSAEEAEAFIRQRKLKEGQVKQTKYSTLIGVFSKPEEAEEPVRRLMQLGYSSYSVPLPGGRFKLYSGAFHTWEGARKQFADLASKGIKSEAVER